MRPVIITQPDNKLRHTVSHTRIHHRLTDSKRAGNSNQNIPRNIFGIFTGRKQICPRHDNRSNRNKEKHIQFDIRKQFFGDRKFTYRCAYNHQDQQQQSKPTLLLSGSIRFITVCQQHKYRRLPPGRNKCIIRHHHKRITFVKHHFIQVRHEPLSATCLDLLHFRPIMTLEIKVLQFLVDTGKTGAQNSFYPMQPLPFLYILIRYCCIRTGIRQQPFGEKKYINNSGNRYKNPHLSQFKHGKPFKSRFQYHSVHHEIGRSTDQRTNTTQDSHI